MTVAPPAGSAPAPAAQEILPRHTWVFPFMSQVYMAYLRLGGGWKVTGTENVPLTGPVILAPNHVSLLDPPLVGVTCGRRPFIMAKAELFRGVVGWAISRMGSFSGAAGKRRPHRAQARPRAAFAG